MSKKITLEMSIYTDGDWGYDRDCFGNQPSKYFDNDLYEYTFVEDEGSYLFRVKRSFELEEGGKEAIREILNKFRASLYGDEWHIEYVTEFIQRAVAELPNVTVDKEYWDDIDGNTEMSLNIRVIENDARKIKEIIYAE